jgi:hypothetical protein
VHPVFLFSEDMDALGLSSSSSSRDKAIKQWSGEKGITFLEFQQQERNDQTLVRSNATGKGLLCSIGMMFERLTTRIKKHSIADKDVNQLIECLADLTMAADLGWYPLPEFPTSAVDHVKKRRPAGVAVEEMLQEMLKSRVVPIHLLALKENSGITDDAHLQQVLSTMLRNPLIGAINPGTGGVMMGTIGSSIGFMRIRVRGRPVTPDAVVMDMFWDYVRRLRTC